jgi:hypothetical protein
MPDPIPDSGTPGPHPATEIPPPTGKVQLWLASMFGASYRTTLSGYAATLGTILLGLGQLTTGKTQQALSLAGIILTGGGIQQMGQHSKDKAVIGAESK